MASITVIFRGLSILICLSLLAAGCSSVGKDSVLFVTKTSLGVDFDTKPPALDIGFNRKEGTIAPVLKEGRVLPQMASFKTELGLANQSVGQHFATGNAAVLMAKYLNTTRGPQLPSGDVIPRDDIIGDLGLIEDPFEKPKDRKRYFFGTDTSYALRVNFSPEMGGIPDGMSFGYKRKEIAYVPIFRGGSQITAAAFALLREKGTLEEIKKAASDLLDGTPEEIKKAAVALLNKGDDDEQKKAALDLLANGTPGATGKGIALASLISTASLDNKVTSGKETKSIYTSFFGTGLAARYLAALPRIRTTVVPQILPDTQAIADDVNKKLAASIPESPTGKGQITNCYNTAEEGTRKSIREAVEKVPTYLSYENFVNNTPKAPTNKQIQSIKDALNQLCSF